MQQIYYDIKYTSAKTDYLSLDQQDMATVQISALGVLTYLTELSISNNQDMCNFTNWFTTQDRRYHYNSRLRCHNSPQSFLAGILNNLQFGKQRDLSLMQLQTLQDIVNTCVDVIDLIECVNGITIQQNKMFTKIWIQQNFFSVP
jgi:hypothetical protein